MFIIPGMRNDIVFFGSVKTSLPTAMASMLEGRQNSLSSNNFSGNVELHLFSKLKKLIYFNLSHNSLSIATTFKPNSSFPQLLFLTSSGCNLDKFPNILRSVNQLRQLNLSENKISDSIPNQIWNIGNEILSYLNLSHNY